MTSAKNIEIKVMVGLPAAAVANSFCATHRSKAVGRDIDKFFIAYSDDQDVMGIVPFCEEKNTPMLRSMRVHAHFRSQKVGLKLLEAFKQKFVESVAQKPHNLSKMNLLSLALAR